MGADIPYMTPGSTRPTCDNLFIIGELGGLALIKNAVIQGRECVLQLVGRDCRSRAGAAGCLMTCHRGRGACGDQRLAPRDREEARTDVTLEQDEIGGTVAKYPRQKLVMTSPC